MLGLFAGLGAVFAGHHHVLPDSTNFKGAADDVKNMMESLKAHAEAPHAAAKSAPKLPRTEADGEVDLDDHKLDKSLIASARRMQHNMEHREALYHTESLGQKKATLTTGESATTKMQRAARWLTAHGMQKIRSAIDDEEAPKQAAASQPPSRKHLVMDMDDDDGEASWGKVDQLRYRSGAAR